MAVSNTQWLMMAWSFSLHQHVGSDVPQSTRNLSVLLLPEIGFHRPFERDQEGVAVAVLGLTGRHPDPALADAIFLDVGLFDTLETDTDIACEHVGVIVGAVRIVGEAVGWCVGHGPSLVGSKIERTPDGANVKSASV